MSPVEAAKDSDKTLVTSSRDNLSRTIPRQASPPLLLRAKSHNFLNLPALACDKPALLVSPKTQLKQSHLRMQPLSAA